MFPHLMRHLRIRRVGRGRARTRPDRVRGDKAYSSRAIRGHLRDRGITAVIPGPADQAGHRKRHGSRDGRNVVEHRFTLLKQWPRWRRRRRPGPDRVLARSSGSASWAGAASGWATRRVRGGS
ncbi:transposase [Amycolatopsis sp. SID8362]|nr:transposase [Amycolatopsis sp. SID8362]NED47685.1 transposase [Amycolatopsis sp. SID8362]